MKGQGKVKGILIEGNDGHEYLLGFGPAKSPILSRRQPDGTFEPLEDIRRASEVAIKQIGHASVPFTPAKLMAAAILDRLAGLSLWISPAILAEARRALDALP
jgi:hypothetical protein